MAAIDVYLETGSKKTFAGALDWPGWCRSGRDETAALQALLAYGPRYAGVLQGAGLDFAVPENISDLTVIERLTGDATTDFGAPGVIPAADQAAGTNDLGPDEVSRLQTILESCWKAFDLATSHAAGRSLRTGPRGGGRDVERIIEHVRGADQGYLSSIGLYRSSKDAADETMPQVRQAIREALAAAAEGSLPTQRARGGEVWPLRYFVRRSAWHVLDHAWEIEDRLE